MVPLTEFEAALQQLSGRPTPYSEGWRSPSSATIARLFRHFFTTSENKVALLASMDECNFEGTRFWVEALPEQAGISTNG